MQLAERAMKTFSHHTTNIDSTKRALNLIDSSIKLYRSPRLYFCKYQIYKSKNDELAALSVCDTVLMFDRNNFSFTLEKGCTFEALGKLDSAFTYYRVALQMIDNSKSFNASEIVKDDEKIVITGLLKDTVAFNKLVNEFRIKYNGSKDKDFQIFSEQLDHFRREDYVN
jgi:tetratricopeptide (TPR) repeat protein